MLRIVLFATSLAVVGSGCSAGQYFNNITDTAYLGSYNLNHADSRLDAVDHLLSLDCASSLSAAYKSDLSQEVTYATEMAIELEKQPAGGL
jgi:hypothetical protein